MYRFINLNLSLICSRKSKAHSCDISLKNRIQLARTRSVCDQWSQRANQTDRISSISASKWWILQSSALSPIYSFLLLLTIQRSPHPLWQCEAGYSIRSITEPPEISAFSACSRARDCETDTYTHSLTQSVRTHTRIGLR